MTLATKAESTSFLSSLFSLAMFLLAMASMFMMDSYLRTGEVEAWASVGACSVWAFVILIFICATTIPVALRLARSTGSRQSLRVLYIYILLPVVFTGFMVGNSASYFLNVLIFGWPLFLASGVLMLLAANWLRVEANLFGVTVGCGACGHSFVIDQDEEVGFCDFCTAPNRNPMHSWAGKGARGQVRAYEPTVPGARARSDVEPGEPLRSLVGSEAVLLAVASFISLVGGISMLYFAWDYAEAALGVLFSGAGSFGLYALYTLSIKRTSLLPVVASASFVVLAFASMVLLEGFGVLFGGFAAVTFYISVRRWTRAGRGRAGKGRKIRVPAGSATDGVRSQVRSR